MSALVVHDGGRDAHTAFRQLSRAENLERTKVKISSTFRFVVKVTNYTLIAPIARRAADMVLGIVNNMADELVIRAAFYEELKSDAAFLLATGEIAPPAVWLAEIEKFDALNGRVITECRRNSDLLFSMNSKSRVADAFLRLEGSAERLGKSVLSFKPLLEEVNQSWEASKESQRLARLFDSRMAAFRAGAEPSALLVARAEAALAHRSAARAEPNAKASVLH